MESKLKKNKEAMTRNTNKNKHKSVYVQTTHDVKSCSCEGIATPATLIFHCIYRVSHTQYQALL